MIPILVSAHSEVTLDIAEIFVYTHILMHLFYIDQVMCWCIELQYYVLTVLLQEIKVLQDVTLRHLASSSRHFQGHDAFIFRDLSSLIGL